MKKGEFAKNLDEIYRDIISIKINASDSFESMMQKFYRVMRHWGICQGTKSENGRTINNAEWIMCFMVFKQHKILAFDTWLILSSPPDDLLMYDEESNTDTSTLSMKLENGTLTVEELDALSEKDVDSYIEKNFTADAKALDIGEKRKLLKFHRDVSILAGNNELKRPLSIMFRQE